MTWPPKFMKNGGFCEWWHHQNVSEEEEIQRHRRYSELYTASRSISIITWSRLNTGAETESPYGECKWPYSIIDYSTNNVPCHKNRPKLYSVLH
jgi:hypothetical protein